MKKKEGKRGRRRRRGNRGKEKETRVKERKVTKKLEEIPRKCPIRRWGAEELLPLSKGFYFCAVVSD